MMVSNTIERATGSDLGLSQANLLITRCHGRAGDFAGPPATTARKSGATCWKNFQVVA
jgi:hypothetical protein